MDINLVACYGIDLTPRSKSMIYSLGFRDIISIPNIKALPNKNSYNFVFIGDIKSLVNKDEFKKYLQQLRLTRDIFDIIHLADTDKFTIKHYENNLYFDERHAISSACIVNLNTKNYARSIGFISSLFETNNLISSSTDNSFVTLLYNFFFISFFICLGSFFLYMLLNFSELLLLFTFFFIILIIIFVYYSYITTDNSTQGLTRKVLIQDNTFFKTLYTSTDATFPNTSMIYNDGKFTALMRCKRNIDNINHTKFLTLDDNFNILDGRYLKIDNPRKRVQIFVSPEGFEDLRLFKHNNKLYALGNNYDTNMYRKTSMVLVDIEKERALYLDYEPTRTKFNKNWSYINYKNDLCVILFVDPLVIVKPNLETGECIEVYKANKKKFDYDFLKLSTNTIPWSDHEVIFIVHITDEKSVTYRSYFAILDVNTMQMQLSREFKCEHSTYPHMEYISGICQKGDDYYINYNLNDRISKITKFSREQILKLYI